MKIILILVGVLAGLIVLGWVGLQVKPRPFPPYPQQAPALQTVPLPKNLPAPVERYYRILYGENIPVITSAVITGRATLRPFGGITLPARFRFTHVAGKDYRHYIEATFFGIPFFVVNETYVDGHGRFEAIVGTDEGEKYDQAANLGMWAESLWFPAIFLTDPRVHWEPVDEDTALLRVPFGESTQTYVVRFDPDTGLVTWFESMRYKASNSPSKTLWLNTTTQWTTRDGKPFGSTGAAIWMDDGKPWAWFTVEDMLLNVDVQEYVRQKGL